MRFRIYDVSGRPVREFFAPARSDIVASGLVAESTWDGRDSRGARVASGVYLVRAEWNGGSSTGRLALVH